jgi:hypothetical protein
VRSRAPGCSGDRFHHGLEGFNGQLLILRIVVIKNIYAGYVRRIGVYPNEIAHSVFGNEPCERLLPFLNLQEIVERVFAFGQCGVGEREIGVGVDAALEIGLLPVESSRQILDCNVKVRNLKFMVERADRVLVESLRFKAVAIVAMKVVIAVRDALVGQPPHARSAAEVSVRLNIAFPVNQPLFVQEGERPAHRGLVRLSLGSVDQFHEVVRAQAEELSDVCEDLSLDPGKVERWACLTLGCLRL